MSQQLNVTDATDAHAAPDAAANAEGPKPGPRSTSDPREVAAIVVNRMRQVKAKQDELVVAIDALGDITRQLTRAYAAQVVSAEQLRKRVRALEGPTATGSVHPSEAAR